QWTGNNSTAWSDNGNWVGGSPQGDSSAVLIFPSNPTHPVSTNNLGSISIQEIDLFGTGYTISSSSAASRIDLGSGGIVASNSSGSDLISAGLTASGANLAVNVSATGGGLDLSDVIDGAIGMVKNGLGSLTMSGPLANAFTGTATVNNGQLRLNKSVFNGAI